MSEHMTPAPARTALADAALSFQLPAEAMEQRVLQIHQTVLGRSRYIRAANYTVIHPDDLELLFAAPVWARTAMVARTARTNAGEILHAAIPAGIKPP